MSFYVGKMLRGRGAHLAAERGGEERRQGARRSVAVPNGDGVAPGSATRVLNETCSINQKRKTAVLKKQLH